MNTPQKGRPAKNPERKFKRIAVTMPPDAEKLLRDKSYETGESMSEIITKCILLELDSNKVKDTPAKEVKLKSLATARPKIAKAK